jgi:hypothetical protein
VIDHRWLGDWLSRIERSWLNDFLWGPGTVACFFGVFTALYATDALFHGETRSIFTPKRSIDDDCSWSDHKRLMKVILYGLLVRALAEGWGEEVGMLASTFVFDPWDLSVELAGVVVGAWLVHTLSYPLFSKAPYFGLNSTVPDFNALPSKFGVDVLSVLGTGFYIFHRGSL